MRAYYGIVTRAIVPVINVAVGLAPVRGLLARHLLTKRD